MKMEVHVSEKASPRLLFPRTSRGISRRVGASDFSAKLQQKAMDTFSTSSHREERGETLARAPSSTCCRLLGWSTGRNLG